MKRFIGLILGFAIGYFGTQEVLAGDYKADADQCMNIDGMFMTADLAQFMHFRAGQLTMADRWLQVRDNWKAVYTGFKCGDASGEISNATSQDYFMVYGAYQFVRDGQDKITRRDALEYLGEFYVGAGAPSTHVVGEMETLSAELLKRVSH